MKEQSELSKILFRIEESEGEANIETLWAEPIGNDLYRLDNSPFYAYSVSWQDIVYAPYSATEELPTFERVEKKSGHKTVRVIFEQAASEENAHLQALVALGCTYEGANGTYFSIDLPANVELDTVKSYLVASGLQWEHADPSYSELYPNAV